MKKERKHIDIGELFSQAWKIYKENWGNFLLIGLIFLIVNTIGSSSGISYNPETKEFIDTGFNLVGIIAWLATVYLTAGYIRYLFHLLAGEKAKVGEIFHGVDSISHFVYIVLVMILVKMIVVFGLVLLIIPGIIAALALMFSQYVIIENHGGEVEVFDALKKSCKMTKGYRWKLLWLSIVLGFFNLFGAIALLVGLVVTIPMSSIIVASVYKELK